ncbi:MAG: hypothetical protein KKF30_17095 [Proteobacteria bacterium]|nr:hypothetical protein [Pseudomonadota bacterium]MBU4469096.1 hypothetical protein [Pseudomonadota bacterium]MCG2752128.1 hypothetical protein [Desulfobacteraceae bacterium]
MMRVYLKQWVWILVVGACVVLIGGAMDPMTKDALKVKHLLGTIETKPSRPDGKELAAEVSEKELNAYIVYRLAQEKNTLVKSLNVHLLDHNQVGGKVRFNPEQLNMGFFFGEDLNFDFKGILHTRTGSARVDLTDLQLYGQPIDPKILDSILKTVGPDGTSSGGLGDWYELPKGIKRIITQRGKAVVYY